MNWQGNPDFLTTQSPVLEEMRKVTQLSDMTAKVFRRALASEFAKDQYMARHESDVFSHSPQVFSEFYRLNRVVAVSYNTVWSCIDTHTSCLDRS